MTTKTKINKVPELKYHIRRLRNSGYPTDVVVDDYGTKDRRKWTIIVGRDTDNVLITCFKNGVLEIYDGEQNFRSKVKYDTDSMEVVMTILHEKGIQSKHPTYGKRDEFEPETETEE